MREHKKEFKNAVLLKLQEGERAVFVGEGTHGVSIIETELVVEDTIDLRNGEAAFVTEHLTRASYGEMIPVRTKYVLHLAKRAEFTNVESRGLVDATEVENGDHLFFVGTINGRRVEVYTPDTVCDKLNGFTASYFRMFWTNVDYELRWKEED